MCLGNQLLDLFPRCFWILQHFCLILCSNLSAVCSFSYIISLDVLITVQSILNSFVLEKEIWGPKHLGLSGHKLLTTDLLQDAESGWQSNKVSDSSFLSSSVLYVLIRFQLLGYVPCFLSVKVILYRMYCKYTSGMLNPLEFCLMS